MPLPANRLLGLTLVGHGLGGLLGGFRRLLLLIADSFRVFLPLVQSCLCLLLLAVTEGSGAPRRWFRCGRT